MNLTGLQKALILHGVRSAAGIFAGAIAAFVFSHSTIIGWVQKACALISNQQALEAGIPAIAVLIATFVMGNKDVLNVDKKIIAAAVTSTVAAANDPDVRNDIASAVKNGQITVPTAPPPNIDDIVAARQNAARGG
jgi:hypothetical protein